MCMRSEPRAERDRVLSLHRLAEIAAEFGADRIGSDALTLAERVSEGRYFVACVGQFKRGKSTLLDALIGQRLLPAGVLPVTAIPTIIRYGNELRARVRNSSREWHEIAPESIVDYVSEERNPENIKRVTAVEVFVCNPRLRSGMCLVDTPGLGSVYSGNTEETKTFLPHIDAAIVVIGADPPLSATELELVKHASKHVKDMLFVLNKADRVSTSEVTAAGEFARRILERDLGKPIGHIYQVSALEELEGKRGRDWNGFVAALELLNRNSGRTLVEESLHRGTSRIAGQVRQLVVDERGALLRPREESQRRIDDLNRLAVSVERSLKDLNPLFAAEQQRLSRIFAERSTRFIQSVAPAVHAELESFLRHTARGSGVTFRRVALAEAQRIVASQIEPWLTQEQEFGEKEYSGSVARFAAMALDFIHRAAESGVTDVGSVSDMFSMPERFREKSRFQFYRMIHIARPASPLLMITDLLLGLLNFYGPIERDAHKFLDKLLEHNASRVQNDVAERAAQSRIKLELEIQGLLRELAAAAQRSFNRASEVQQHGEEAVQAALDRLRALGVEIQEIASSDAA